MSAQKPTRRKKVGGAAQAREVSTESGIAALVGDEIYRVWVEIEWPLLDMIRDQTPLPVRR